MRWRGDNITTLVLLLICACLWSSASAARTPEERKEQSNPYLILPPGVADGSVTTKPPRSLGEKTFTLRHVYHRGSHLYPRLHRYVDIHDLSTIRFLAEDGETYEDAPTALRAKIRTMNIQRMKQRSPSDIDGILDYAYAHGRAIELPADAWTDDEVAGPNITDKETVITFAKMAANAYTTPFGSDWKDVKGGFNYTEDFGWQQDGLRGHIFADTTNATIVIALKGTSTWLDNWWLSEQDPTVTGQQISRMDDNKISGTSPAVFDGADTTGNDKLNDNLFGSCCCAQGGQLLWKQVCDCMTSAYTCNQTCLVRALREKGHYYRAVRELYSNVTERYPHSDVWLTGHSLGGVVSSLLGLTHGLPTLTYEAYPDALAASRLGLPVPPGYRIGAHQTRVGTGVYHFGQTADPIYMGSCNRVTDYCTIGGYAFEGYCHTGQTCTYDTVNDLGWRVGIGNHKINNVIKQVLEKYDHVPACDTDLECQDCYAWKFYQSNGSDPITTSKSSTKSATRTRTETCKTPGWWGCLDESTTSGATATTTRSSSSSSSVSSTSTSTCKTPGWFGCNDPTTTKKTTSSSTIKSASITVPTTTTASSSTTICLTPGWFGCNDPTSVSTGSAKPASTPTAALSTPTQSSLPTASPEPAHKVCVKRHWYGLCQEWDIPLWPAKNDLR